MDVDNMHVVNQDVRKTSGGRLLAPPLRPRTDAGPCALSVQRVEKEVCPGEVLR